MMQDNPYTTIIIDDEPPALQRLDDLLSDFPDTFNVIGQSSNGRKAVELINDLKPDLIFLDIQMPGLNGFEVMEQLHEMPLVIFCTAFDQYALQAFQTNSVDYLLKPVRKERLEQTIDKLDYLKSHFNPIEIKKLLKSISSASKSAQLTSITIRNGNKITFVKLEDVAYFKASEKYVSIFTKAGDEKIINKTISELENELPSDFIRIQRSLIINQNLVKEVQSHFNSRFIFLLEDVSKSKLTSGRKYQSEIKNWMGL